MILRLEPAVCDITLYERQYAVQADLVLFYCTSLYCASQMIAFCLLIKG